MSVQKMIPACGVILLLATATTHGNVVRIEITRTEPAGPSHERISGKAYGELDPADPRNALIADIEFAPRNARGKVEYAATFSLVKAERLAGSAPRLSLEERYRDHDGYARAVAMIKQAEASDVLR